MWYHHQGSLLHIEQIWGEGIATIAKTDDDLSHYKWEMFEELKVLIVDSNIDKSIFEFSCDKDKIIWKKKGEKWPRLFN